VGAALGWSIRVLFDTCMMTYMGSRVSGLSISVFAGQWLRLGVALLVLILPAVIAVFSGQVLNWSLAILPICLVVYIILAWNTLFQKDEREWAKLKLNGLLAHLLK
ncbi:MAG TPA: hypothetical protein PLK77_04705, partial [Pyrinomonadaceae bacterium]|nr:hypothetical protein [Pyrinomonadaceae bacterium]